MSVPARDQPMPEYDPERLADVAQRYGLRLVVLYGSHAKHRAGPESDLDIAVLGCRAEEFLDCYTDLAEAFQRYSMDLVRLEDADPLLRQEIMHQGILLRGDPDSFYEYRAYAYRDFVDSSDLFALEDLLYRKKMARMKEKLYGSA
ncbi:type VII toxin-antitoxin system MntA family adenylyltransferase antitoxin [Pelomicrobium methylotrophicum]|nr:nucleotidyltransferase domain-containing protein [Pelomicrobium methylotrophicum]